MRVYPVSAWLLALITALVALGQGAPAAASSAQAAVIPVPLPQGQARADIACHDFRGRAVQIVDTPGLGDVGRAEIGFNGPVIKLDPAVLQPLPVRLQIFFELHECAHHALGHLYAPTDKSEREADCWAIKRERLAGLTKDEIISWKPAFAQSRGSAAGHLPGPQRVEYLLGCFDDP